MMKPQDVLVGGITQFVVRDVITIPSNAPVDFAMEQYRSSPYKTLLIVEPGTRALSGIITDWDLATGYGSVAPKTADDLARKEVIAVRQDAQLWQLLKIMNGENAIRRTLDVVPVVDEQSRPIGIVKRDRLMDSLSQLESGSNASAFSGSIFK